MSGILVLGESVGAELRPSTLELIGAALELAEQGAGPVAVALIGAEGAAHAEALGALGVEEVILAAPGQAHFEAHVWEAALSALVEIRRPVLVLAGHTVDSLGFAPAVAARGRLGFASDVTALRWEDGAAVARRSVEGGRHAELDFPGKESVLLLLRAGAFQVPPNRGGGTASTSRPDIDVEGCARSERVELRAAPSGEVDIAKADLLLSLGRGIGGGERMAQLERLAARMGATLSGSGPLVEMGLISRARKVGQSGKTVAPRVYLALGISGAPQHLAGISKAGMIIAINSDPNARIFEVAHYGAVADLFEVAGELERQFS